MIKIPTDETTHRITVLADYQMKKAYDILYDAKLYGPCQNKVWFEHLSKLLDELDDCIEELHTWEAVE